MSKSVRICECIAECEKEKWNDKKSHKHNFQIFQSRMSQCDYDDEGEWGNFYDIFFPWFFSWDFSNVVLNSSYMREFSLIYFLISFPECKTRNVISTVWESWDRGTCFYIFLMDVIKQRRILIHHFSQFTLVFDSSQQKFRYSAQNKGYARLIVIFQFFTFIPDREWKQKSFCLHLCASLRLQQIFINNWIHSNEKILITRNCKKVEKYIFQFLI